MKRVFLFILVLLTLSFMLSGCGQRAQVTEDTDKKMSVVCTVFPVYDWLTEIIGEDNDSFEIHYLAKNGDIHSFSPSMQDIVKITISDLLIYVGGESDIWAKKIVDENSLNFLNLFDVNSDWLLDAEHSHTHEHHEEGAVYDEHIWLSLDIARRSVEAICNELCALDPENADKYRRNAENYSGRLETLDREYEEVAENSEDKTIIVADRFPFLYLTNRYNIEPIAALSGCSADSDASFEVIARLARAVDVYQKQTILVLENPAQSVAETVVKTAKRHGTEIAVMNSCQMVGMDEIEAGADYIEIMTENLEVLKKALE